MAFQDCADILHPLSSLHWGPEYSYMECEEYHHGCSQQAVLLKGVVYLCFSLTSQHFPNVLTAVSISGQVLWTRCCTLGVFNCTLATFRSKLVLVGGRRWPDLLPIDEVWASEDGIDWEQSLPRMPTRRSDASTVNTNNPDCLVVAGGRGGGVKQSMTLQVVEVLMGNQWSVVQPLPWPEPKHWSLHTAFHNGRVYMMKNDEVYHCNLSALLKGSTEWQELLCYSSPHGFTELFSFGKHLVGLCDESDDVHRFYAYCPHTHMWVHVGGMPRAWRRLFYETSLVALGNELIVYKYSCGFKAAKATLKG